MKSEHFDTFLLQNRMEEKYQLYYNERNKALERPYFLKEIFGWGREISMEFILFSHSIWTDCTDGDILFTKMNKAENRWTNVQWVPVGKLNFVREINLCQNGSRFKTPKGRSTEHTSRSWRIACQRPSLTSQTTSVVQQLPFQWTQFGATDIQFRPSRSLPEDEFQQCVTTLAYMH